MDLATYLQLFEEHHSGLFRFAYRLTGSVADAEDVVQECFLEMARPGSKYDPKRTPARTYLFGIVRNQSLKRLRRHNSPPAGAAFPTPEAEALRGELEREVAQAILQLPENQRDVLVLAHYEQMPLAEIAALVGIEVGAVKSRLQRARASLKETLAEYATQPEKTSLRGNNA